MASLKFLGVQHKKRAEDWSEDMTPRISKAWTRFTEFYWWAERGDVRSKRFTWYQISGLLKNDQFYMKRLDT